MKAAIVIFFVFVTFSANAFSFFIGQSTTLPLLNYKSTEKITLLPIRKPAYIIPPYKTPKGAVFCRMEEKVTKVSGLWLKVGVGFQNK